MRLFRPSGLAGFVLACLFVLGVAGTSASGFSATERVSVDTAGQQGNGASFGSAISGDGSVVAFESNASSLVPGDTNFDQDVFVRDRVAGTTERVSVGSGSAQGNQNSGRPAISADGRYVAFESMASNLVAGGTNGWSQVFVHDRQTGVTELVSVDGSGVQGDGASDEPAISADGRYVAFTSFASNLVSGDTNGAIDVFVHDRLTGTTERVSVDSAGAQADGDSWPYAVALSSDGRYVAFSSDAKNLVPDDTNDTWDAFVHDRQTGATQRVSVGSAGEQITGSGNYFGVAIDGDGGRVAFESDAPDVVPGQSGSTVEVFVRDLGSGTTAMASVDGSGGQAPGSLGPAMSADGRFVAFWTGSALAVGDVNNTADVYVRDLSAGTTRQVSVDGAGNGGNNYSQLAAVDSDGGTISFASDSTNLSGSDTNGATDVFVHTFGALQPAPGAPSNAVAAAGDASASVSWIAPTANGSSITSYTVIPSPAAPTVTVDGSTTTATVTGLANGTSYTFTVVAAAGSQTGPPSIPTASVTPTAGAKTPTSTAADVPPGGTATTDPTGAGPTAESPTTAAVTVPVGGTVDIAIASHSAAPPTGFSVLGEQVTISAPTATPTQPLTLSFVLDASLVGALAPSAVQMFRTENSGSPVEVQNCTGASATPDPCVQSRTVLTGGDLRIVVLTSSASIWSLAADLTPPTITCGFADGNWHPADVTIACSASDSGSGLATSSDATFSLTTSVAAGTETALAITSSHQVCDKASNCATAGPIGGNKIDKKQPTATITAPAAGAVYRYRQPVTASYTCGDGGSGLSTCLGTAANGGGSAAVASGGALPTGYPGAATLTLAAKDNVGNTSSASRSYSVLFNFGGFFAPIANAPTINQASSGKNLAVPFKLTDYNGGSIYSSLGLNILVPGYPAVKAVSCPAGAAVNRINSYTSQSGLRYDSKNIRYEYDLAIPATWITANGTCQQVTLKFRDGTSQSFYLSVTR